MDQKSDIWNAFKDAARKKAELQTMLLSKRGDRNTAFYEFLSAFAFAHTLVAHNSKFRDHKYKGTTLSAAIAAWVADAVDYHDSEVGFALFDEFNLALGRLGLI